MSASLNRRCLPDFSTAPRETEPYRGRARGLCTLFAHGHGDGRGRNVGSAFCQTNSGPAAHQCADRVWPPSPCAGSVRIIELYPDVSIELIMSDRAVDLVEERFDVAISSYPLAHANLIRRVLLPLRWIVCCTPIIRSAWDENWQLLRTLAITTAFITARLPPGTIFGRFLAATKFAVCRYAAISEPIAARRFGTRRSTGLELAS